MKAYINNQPIPLEIKQTPDSKSIGMMGRQNLEGGMLFPFDTIGERSFWMKNCLIPLDILFISGNKINSISHNCPPCYEHYCKSYTGIGDMVLEVVGGYCIKNNIQEGDSVYFE
tara:strand:+ start:1066 stop:1407 length:342 start_codon:yes stop_codon:yes gene_type:complete